MSPDQTHSTARVIAFDFDGTLTTRDTFVEFMKAYRGAWRWRARMVRLVPVFVAYKLGRVDRHAVKRAVVNAVFAGEPIEHVQERARDFAQNAIPALLRPAGVARFRERVAESAGGGPTTVICSASLSLYLRAFAKGFAVDGGEVPVLACELEVDPDTGHCTGRLAGLNVWGPNKVRVLASHFDASKLRIVEAYGDSEGDRQMLEAAETAYWRPFRAPVRLG